jgi:hypothetical protein
MKTTYKKIRESTQALVFLGEKVYSTPKVNLRITKLLKKVREEADIYNEIKYKLLKEFGEKKTSNAGDPIYVVKPENFEIFREKHNELDNTEVDIPIKPLQLSELTENVKEGNSNEFSTRVIAIPPITLEPLISLGAILVPDEE